MTFATPQAFLLLLLLPVAALWKRRGRPAARASGIAFASPVSHAGLQGLASKSLRLRYGPRLLKVFYVTAFVLVVIALARPRTGSISRDIEADARDIVFALDISASMQALDFSLGSKRVDRLQALKSVMAQFISARAGDRLGLVVFGEKVFTQCPLTLDHNLVHELVQALEVGMAGQGTAIGDGLGIALKRLEAFPSSSKAIVLVTDGKSNSGTLLPLDAAEIARQKGVRIYTIGIGGPEPAPFPTKNILGMTVLIQVPMEYDGETLERIAEMTGGTYFNAKNVEGLRETYAEIDRLERRRDRGLEFVEYQEEFLPFLIGAVIAFFAAELITTVWLVRVP